MFKVICVKTHSQGVVKRGVVYPVYAISECGCGINYDVGIKPKSFLRFCSGCNKLYSGNIHWIASELFRPINDDFVEETLEQIKEQIEQEYLVLK